MGFGNYFKIEILKIKFKNWKFEELFENWIFFKNKIIIIIIIIIKYILKIKLKIWVLEIISIIIKKRIIKIIWKSNNNNNNNNNNNWSLIIIGILKKLFENRSFENYLKFEVLKIERNKIEVLKTN